MTDVIKGGKGKQGGGYVFPLLIFFYVPVGEGMESKGGKKTTLMVLSAVVTLTKDLIHWYKFKAILFVCRGRCLHLI